MSGGPRPSGATLKAVAEAAGVSVSAVCKVLNGKGDSVRVSEPTAANIREAARKLKYSPNALARSLRLAKTHTVGLIFENFGQISAGPLYYVELLDGIVSELFARRYRLTILPEFPMDAAATTLGDGRLDGVIWCKMPQDLALHQELFDRGLPIIALNSTPPKGSPMPHCVSCDNATGSELVVDHLTTLGHRRILFAMERREDRTPDALGRLSGFREAMAKRGLSAGEEDTVCWHTDAREFPAWFDAGPAHTAIFAWNERLGGEILARALATGLEVPRQLSVVGFDSTRFCESTVPRLTAVRQPIKEMAQTAAKSLLSLIDEELPKPCHFHYPCTLDVRESTAPPDEAGRFVGS